LSCFSIFTSGIINIEHPHNIFAVFQSWKDFEFSWYIFASFLCSFYCDCLVWISVVSLKNIAFRLNKWIFLFIY
jgi:H+/Cl- antiporter ClcA